MTNQAMTDAFNNVKANYDALMADKASYAKVYADDRALPEEADAWDAGTRAGAAVKAAFGH